MSTFKSVLEDDRQGPRLCLRCQKIVSAKVKYGNPGVYGFFPHDLHGWCSFCKLIAGFLPWPLRHDELGLVNISYNSYTDEVSYRGQRLGTIVHRGDMPRSAIVTNTTGILEPSIVRQWIDDCERGHENGRMDSCHTGRSGRAIDLTLIDFANLCLVRASSRERFCALSYVWGGVTGLQTTTLNRAILEVPGSLGNHSRGSLIPRSIREAIVLVSTMGERFLWVDALCIEQDNDVQKHSQIQQMDIIYSHALLTIVALSGTSANSPLPGVTPGTRPPRSMATSLAVPNSELPIFFFAEDVTPREELARSVYNERAWTFQERLLAKRCLFLCKNRAYLSCRHGLHQSEYPTEQNILESAEETLGLCYPYFDHLSIYEISSYGDTQYGLYASLVDEYRNKRLSRSSDNPNGIAGVLAVLADKFGWHFISGHPEEHLEHSLLWCPAQENPKRNKLFPSWSWAGWDCRTMSDPTHNLFFERNLWNHAFGMGYRYSELNNLSTFSQTPKRRIIRQPQECGMKVEPTQIPAESRCEIDILNFYAFAAAAENFIFSRTTKDIQIREVVGYLIVDFEGNICGALCFGSFGPDLCRAQTMELILLSRSDKGDDLNEEGLNIMLIEWKDGRAERLNIGVMRGNAFMNANPVWKEIQLGWLSMLCLYLNHVTNTGTTLESQFALDVEAFEHCVSLAFERVDKHVLVLGV